MTTGISYGRVLPGLVSEFEEREAAAHSGYNWREWQAVSHDEKADAIAYCRLRRLVDMHSRDAVEADSRRRERARRARQRQE